MAITYCDTGNKTFTGIVICCVFSNQVMSSLVALKHLAPASFVAFLTVIVHFRL